MGRNKPTCQRFRAACHLSLTLWPFFFFWYSECYQNASSGRSIFNILQDRQLLILRETWNNGYQWDRAAPHLLCLIQWPCNSLNHLWSMPSMWLCNASSLAMGSCYCTEYHCELDLGWRKYKYLSVLFSYSLKNNTEHSRISSVVFFDSILLAGCRWIMVYSW